MIETSKPIKNNGTQILESNLTPNNYNLTGEPFLGNFRVKTNLFFVLEHFEFF